MLVLLTSFVLVASVSYPADAQQAEPLTVIVLPDTQNYVTSDAGTVYFQAQIDWVLAERTSRNIVFVSHEGDVANSPTDVAQWQRADGVLATFDSADMPYGIAPGNHDMEPGGAAPQYDALFGVDRFVAKSWFGGGYEPTGTRASYQTVSAEGVDLLFVHVRHLLSTYGDNTAVHAWVKQVLEDHPSHLAFVTTHEFTHPDGSVIMPELQTVVEGVCNVAAVFSGHRFGAAHGTVNDRCGRPVLHVLTNYQNIENGGNGFLRVLEIDPSTLATALSVYSPALDQNLVGPAEDFSYGLAAPHLLGDVSCDGAVGLSDAFMILQFSVGLRTDSGGCPLVDQTAELFVDVGDVNGDAAADIGDAFLILQCSVGLTNPFCPG